MRQLIKISLLLVLLNVSAAGNAAGGDTVRLTMSQVIRMAQESSPQAVQARNTFESAWLSYRSYRASMLPTLSLSSSPSLNRSTNYVTLPDGSELFARSNSMRNNVSLDLSQNVWFTGGTISLSSNLSRLDQLGENPTHSYYSQPLQLSFSQDGTSVRLNAGYGSFNTAESELSVNTRQGKFSALASGSYNRTDGHRDNMNFEQFAGYAKLGYDISDNWNASANVDITRFKASQPGSVSTPLIDADQDITRGTSALFIENNYRNTSGAVSLFYSWGNHWINDGHNVGADPKAFRFISYDEMWGASAWQSASLFEGNRLTLGLDYYRYGGKANNHFVDGPTAGTDVLQVDASEDEIAGYIEDRQAIGDWLTLNAGLRVDHHSKAGTELVPQYR